MSGYPRLVTEFEETVRVAGDSAVRVSGNTASGKEHEFVGSHSQMGIVKAMGAAGGERMSAAPQTERHDAPPVQASATCVKKWLTTTEAAEYLSIEPRTLSLWARQGKVKSYLLSGTLRQTRRFLVSDLDDMLTTPSADSETRRTQ
jgi:excisionase family DNA binding protein